MVKGNNETNSYLDFLLKVSFIHDGVTTGSYSVKLAPRIIEINILDCINSVRDWKLCQELICRAGMVFFISMTLTKAILTVVLKRILPYIMTYLELVKSKSK